MLIHGEKIITYFIIFCITFQLNALQVPIYPSGQNKILKGQRIRRSLIQSGRKDGHEYGGVEENNGEVLFEISGWVEREGVDERAREDDLIHNQKCVFCPKDKEGHLLSNSRLWKISRLKLNGMLMNEEEPDERNHPLNPFLRCLEKRVRLDDLSRDEGMRKNPENNLKKKPTTSQNPLSVPGQMVKEPFPLMNRDQMFSFNDTSRTTNSSFERKKESHSTGPPLLNGSMPFYLNPSLFNPLEQSSPIISPILCPLGFPPQWSSPPYAELHSTLYNKLGNIQENPNGNYYFLPRMLPFGQPLINIMGQPLAGSVFGGGTGQIIDRNPFLHCGPVFCFVDPNSFSSHRLSYPSNLPFLGCPRYIMRPDIERILAQLFMTTEAATKRDLDEEYKDYLELNDLPIPTFSPTTTTRRCPNFHIFPALSFGLPISVTSRIQ